MRRFLTTAAIVLALVTAGWWAAGWWAAGDGRRGSTTDDRAVDGASSVPAPGLGRRDAIERDDEASFASGRIGLRGRSTVRVLDAVDRAPVVDADVWAEFAVGGAFRDRSPAVHMGARGRHLGEGRYELTSMPVDRATRIDVTSPRHLRTSKDVASGEATSKEVEVVLERALSLEEGSARVVLDLVGDVAGLDPSQGGLVLVSPGGRYDFHRLTDPIGIDFDPAGRSTLEGTIELLLPGYSAQRGPLVLERGKTTRLRVDVPPRVSLRIRTQAPSGEAIAGARVTAWPDVLHRTYREPTAMRAVTAADGVATLPARQVGRFEISVGADGHHFPSAQVFVSVDRSDVERVLTGVPLTSVTVELEGHVPAAPFVATTSIEHESVRTSTHALLLASAEPRDRRSVDRDYVAALPRTAPVTTAPDGRPRLRIGLLPGSYSVALRTPESASLPETFEVGEAATTLRVRLTRWTNVSYRIVAAAGAPLPSPYAGAIWIGHRAGWAERYEIARSVGLGWHFQAEAYAAGKASASDVVLVADSMLARARKAEPSVPPDVACIGEDGAVELPRLETSGCATLLVGTGHVAIVDPVPSGSGGGRTPVTVPVSALQGVRLRFVDAAGAPRSNLAVHVNPVAPLARGEQQLTPFRRTDEQGELSVDALADEEFGVFVRSEGLQAASVAHATARPTTSESGRSPYVVIRSQGEGAFVELRPAR